MSRRKLTPVRKLVYFLLAPLIRGWIRLVWTTSKITLVGEAPLLKLIQAGEPVIPCYWHQSLLMCSYYLIRLQKQGLRPGFLISPSVDGEVAAKIVRAWGAHAIRGSSTRTGAQAIRDLYMAITSDKISPANTPDGPTGPAFKVKPGVAMLAQTTGTSIIPMACASRRTWYFNSWDRFMLPKPFSHLVICVAEPLKRDKTRKMADLEFTQIELEQRLNTAKQTAEAYFKKV